MSLLYLNQEYNPYLVVGLCSLAVEYPLQDNRCFQALRQTTFQIYYQDLLSIKEQCSNNAVCR